MGSVAAALVVAAVCLACMPGGGARMRANEAVAAACLRTCAGAQNMYRRIDYDNDKIFEYACPYVKLNTEKQAGRPLRLIDDALANASRDNPPDGVTRPKAGYIFVDLKGDEGGEAYAPDGENYVAGYGLCAYPAKYRRTGTKTFVINIQGIVYEKDTGGKPVTKFPDPVKEGWRPVGG